MKARLLSSLILVCIAAACGDDGPAPPADGPPPDIGFNKPTAPLKGNANNAELGPADLSCLGTPSTDQATTVDVALTTTVTDFQNGSIVPSAAVTVFQLGDPSLLIDMKTADDSGMVTVTIPTGTKRFNFEMTAQGSLDTLLLNQIVQPSMMTQTIPTIQTVSMATATLLPALINKSRTPGTGVLAGAMSDCAGHELSNFIATVSSTRGTAAPLPGADTYYFDPMAGLPVRHNQRAAASADGLFMVIELPVTEIAYVQIWGYPTDADLAADQLKLVAELAAPVIADTVITGAYEPLRQ